MLTRFLNSLTCLLVLTVLVGCNPKGKAVFDGASISGGNTSSGTVPTATDASIVFNGLDSISDKTDSTLVLNWTTHADAVAYDIFNMTSGSPVYVTTASGQATSSVSLSGLTPSAAYSFRVRLRTSGGFADTNTNDFSFTMNAAPNTPSALSLVTPSVSPGLLTTPTIQVSGVKNGDVIKLFTDAACTAQVASATATGATINLTTSALIPGSYTLYANSTNLTPTSSACSGSSLAYIVSGSFSGAVSVSNKTDTTLTLNWVSHSDAIAYDVFSVSAGVPTYLSTAIGQSATSIGLTGLTPSASYNFRVRLRAIDGSNDSNTNDLAVTMNAAPNIPTALALVTPASSPSLNTTPTIQVSGVKSGDTVKLFTNNTCSAQVASGIATGTTINLTTSALTAGAYTLYANATNSIPTASACSTASVAYTVTGAFAGLASISNLTDSSLTLNWATHPSAVAYDVFTISGGTPTFFASAAGQSTFSINLTGLTPSAPYDFRVRMRLSDGSNDSNTNDLPVTMNAAPNIPFGLSLVTPSSSPSLNTTPTIQVIGVKSGDTVKLFTNNTCSTQVASGVATATTINLTSSALTAGAYTFYATSSNSVPNSSACSTATLAYTVSAGFAGVSSVSNKTDSTLTLNWTVHAAAVGYDVFRINAGIPTYITTVSGQASSSVNLTGLIPSTAYNFRVRLRASDGSNDTNTNDLAVTMNAAPDVPSALSLVTPTSSPSMVSTPTIQVSGVKSGDTVKIFTNNTCSTQVASGVATGSTISLTTSSLVVGAYTLYANSTNSTPTASACSTASLAYTRTSGFSGASSVSNKTDTTLTLNWTAHASAVSYDIFTVSGGVPTYITTVLGQASTSVNIVSLTPSATYNFRVRLRASDGSNDTNTNDLAVTMNAAPNVPSALTLITPSSSPGSNATPTIRVSGVKSGDIVRLYSNNTCTTQIASGTASGTTIDLITSTLTDGSYTIYANARNSVPNVSACSTANVAYVLSTCPTNYIPVPANATFGITSTFCVAKYEMKNVGNVATSQASLVPWTSILPNDAKTACTNLGASYDLISNPEWMTIAYEIEKTASNWSGNAVGSGGLYRGHSDGSAVALEVTNTSDGYNLTGNAAGNAYNSGQEQRRTLTLSNGEVIWDFAGNAIEFVDWSKTAGLQVGPINCTASWLEMAGVSAGCPTMMAADYFPDYPAGVPLAVETTGSNYGYGRLQGAGNNASAGLAQRGGGYWDGVNSGIYSMLMNNGVPGFSAGILGFRCVYRP